MANLELASANNKHVVLFHDPCSDGNFARLVAEKALSPKWTVLPVPSPPGRLPTAFSIADSIAPGDVVWVLDTCYAESVLDELQARSGNTVRVLDHHRFSRAIVIGRPDCVHDNKRSGCVLAWEYFFPGVPIPLPLLYVQDRDLWRWKLAPESKLFCAHVYRSVPFSAYASYLDPARESDLVQEALEKGLAALREIETAVDRLVANVQVHSWMGVRTAVVQVDRNYASDAGDRLLALAAESGDGFLCDCALLWTAATKTDEEAATISVSLRSRGAYDSDDDLVSVSADVDALARVFGGGGHATASGFTCLDLREVLDADGRNLERGV